MYSCSWCNKLDYNVQYWNGTHFDLPDEWRYLVGTHDTGDIHVWICCSDKCEQIRREQMTRDLAIDNQTIEFKVIPGKISLVGQSSSNNKDDLQPGQTMGTARIVYCGEMKPRRFLEEG